LDIPAKALPGELNQAALIYGRPQAGLSMPGFEVQSLASWGLGNAVTGVNTTTSPYNVTYTTCASPESVSYNAAQIGK
jgi:hypothetical protein